MIYLNYFLKCFLLNFFDCGVLWAVFKLGVPWGTADCEENQTEEITPSFNHLALSHVHTLSLSGTGITLSSGCRQEYFKQYLQMERYTTNWL